MSNIVINEVIFNQSNNKGIVIFREDDRYDSKAAFTVKDCNVSITFFYYHKCNEKVLAKEITEFLWN